MAAVSTNNRLCQGIRMLVPGVRPSTASSAGHRQIVVREVGSQRDVDVGVDVPTNNVNSIAAQLSILRLSSPVSPISGFPFSSSLAAAAFHSSAWDESAKFLDEPKKRARKQPAEEKQPLPRSIEELPEKPKRPITAWIEFANTNRPLVKKAQPSLKATEVFKVLGEMWKRVSPTEKEKYTARERRRYAIYEKELDMWNASVTEDEKLLLKSAKAQVKSAKDSVQQIYKQKREKKALLEELGKPKRPLSVFFLFLKEQRERLPAGSKSPSLADWAAKYKLLPTAEMERLTKMQNVQKKSYEAALEEWNRKMEKNGMSGAVLSAGGKD